MKKTAHIGLFFSVVLFLISCAGGLRLRAEAYKEAAEPEGKYSLILYGGRHDGDPDTMAFIDLEGDAYDISPSAPPFDYNVIKGMEFKQALSDAGRFFSYQKAYAGLWTEKILYGDVVIGYALRPLYSPYLYGESDVLDVHYRLGPEGKAKVYIRLKERIENLIRTQDK
jgi:hypothetical protein